MNNVSKRTRSYGDPAVAARLRAARFKAGFRSARAAALKHGWPEGTYRNHESGTRAISDEDAKQYCQAFGVPEGFLTNYGFGVGVPGPEVLLSSFERQVADTAEQDRREAGYRLRAARLLSGFMTASEAAKWFGLSRPTYGGHENGVNRISENMAKVYGLAFGVHPDWLLTGEFPSGLPDEIDEILRQDRIPNYPDKHWAGRFAHLRKPTKGNPDEVQRLIHQLRNEEARVSGTAAHEFLPEPVSKWLPNLASKDFLHERPIHGSRTWGLPKGATKDLFGCSPDQVVILVVSADIPSEGLSVGDRVFVDVSDRTFQGSGLYATLSSEGSLGFARSAGGRHGPPPNRISTGVPRHRNAEKEHVIGRVTAKLLVDRTNQTSNR